MVMYFAILSTLWILSHCVLTSFSNSNNQNLTAIGLLPLTEKDGYSGRNIQLAVEEALKDVNNDNHILPGYNLIVHWVDSKCDGGATTRAIFDVLHSVERIMFIYGGYCSYVTKSIAESVSYFNRWQISFLNTDPTLADSTTYKNFLRVIPNELDYNLVWLNFLKLNNWTRAGLLFQDASSGVPTYAYTHNALSSMLKEGNVTVLTTGTVTQAPQAALDNIMLSDSRIIIGNFDHIMAKRIICMSYHLGIYGYKYVWLLSQAASYPPNWWTDAHNCTIEEMETALNGHFTVDIVTLHLSDDTIKYSNLDAQRRYNKEGGIQLKLKRGRYENYGIDGVWLMAHALHRFVEASSLSTPDWNEWYSITNASRITQGSFTGLTGDVRFSGRNRLGYLHLMQRQDGSYKRVGLFNMTSQNLSLSENKIYWHGYDLAPTDRTLLQFEDIRPNMIIRVTMMILATVGLILAIVFLFFNIKWASHRHIKMSSPKMNNVIVVGCILVYSTVFIMKIDPTNISDKTLQVICIARTWVLSFGFSLSFGALFAKTWRVYTIFNSPHSQKRLITDGILFLVVVFLLFLDVVLLVTWAVVDPLLVKEEHMDPIEEENRMITGILHTCESKQMNIWTATLYAYKGILLVIGCFFAWQTRHVNIPALNDSKYIGMSVYNVVIMCTSAVAISYVITSQQDHSDLIISLLIILCTTITLCLVFVPKIMHVRRDPKGTMTRPRLSARSNSSRRNALPSRSSADNFASVEQEIAQLEQDILVNQTKLNAVNQELNNLVNTCKTGDDTHTSCESTLLTLQDTSRCYDTVSTTLYQTVTSNTQANGYHMMVATDDSFPMTADKDIQTEKETVFQSI